MDTAHVVLDTTILFGSLLHRQARIRETILTDPTHIFFSPRFVVVELFKHKERIAASTQLKEEELLRMSKRASLTNKIRSDSGDFGKLLT